ncbi:MAG: DUF4834 family protein [Parabacteroides sp.]
MFKFLFILFFFFLLLLFLLGFSILRSFKQFLFGSSESKHRSSNRRSSSQSQRSRMTYQQTQPQRRKIFHKDEGEYVDYEEVK